MEYLRRLLKNPRLQAAIMAGFNLAIVFGALQWDRIEISAVNATLGVWLLVARETFEKDLAKMAQEAAEAKVALPGPPPHPSV